MTTVIASLLFCTANIISCLISQGNHGQGNGKQGKETLMNNLMASADKTVLTKVSCSDPSRLPRSPRPRPSQPLTLPGSLVRLVGGDGGERRAAHTRALITISHRCCEGQVTISVVTHAPTIPGSSLTTSPRQQHLTH